MVRMPVKQKQEGRSLMLPARFISRFAVKSCKPHQRSRHLQIGLGIVGTITGVVIVGLEDRICRRSAGL